jgi:hypothetical protein
VIFHDQTKPHERPFQLILIRPKQLGIWHDGSIGPLAQEQIGIGFPREDPFAPASKKSSRTVPERGSAEPSLLPEEDEYFSFEI